MLTYKVDDNLYEDYVTRNEVPLSQDSINIRYLSFLPSVCRVDSFEGNYLGYIIAWILFFVFTTMVFFIPNDTMPKNSFIYFSRQKPFIHMIVK
ncbi:MAG: hypothetical protein JWQ27_439 [Ferruginibacter sp.]|nr:hypothetical protein [Ferruginibacter sp.]